MSGVFGLALVETLLASLDQAPLILGSVVFSGHEVPARIKVGGKQAVSLHRLPGGGRVIDAMGSDEGEISWTGFFTGPFAAARARLVDAIRRSGDVVGLSFGDYAFNVVVVHFDYDLQDRGAVISYRIRTEILTPASPASYDTAGAIAASIVSDLSIATSLLPAAGAGAGLSQAQNLLASAANPTSAQTLSQVGNALMSGGQMLESALSTTGAGLMTGAGGFGQANAATMPLDGLAQNAGALASLAQSSGYVNRSQSSLNTLAGLPQGDPLIFA